MMHFQKQHYEIPQRAPKQIPNLWDLSAFIIIFGVFAALAWAASQMLTPYNIGQPLEISLAPSALPNYALRTVLRMFIALFLSLMVTLTVAPLAAKNRQAEKLIIPLIDIFQSIPILGMLSLTVVAFISLFPNSLLGPECAAIFAIFTSQVWNMILSFYQSIKTIPKDYYDAATMFHLSTWQRFWRIECPHAIPSLLWNTMLSMSAGWFFVVASEAISVSNQHILLPGIGSYISKAIIESNMLAICYAILTMFIVILIYDQLLFRPLLVWAERFKTTTVEDEIVSTSWFHDLLTRTYLLKRFKIIFQRLYDLSLIFNRMVDQKHLFKSFSNPLLTPYWRNRLAQYLNRLWNSILFIGTLTVGFFLWHYLAAKLGFAEIQKVFFLGGITGLKVAFLIILASLVWIPIGVKIGLNPRITQRIQPLIQFLAAFPVNLVYPVVVLLVLKFNLNVEIWTMPLIILGTQWYILFNVIAGASSIPKDLQLVAQNFGVKNWLLWKRLMLPAIFPFYITGAITAAGGAWNASIVAEVLQWGNQKLVATGLGSYIAEHTSTGDFPRIVLGIGVMCTYVILINRLIWNKLYQFATTRFALE
jgi:NitT/TauT family transport system permease protein